MNGYEFDNRKINVSSMDLFFTTFMMLDPKTVLDKKHKVDNQEILSPEHLTKIEEIRKLEASFISSNKSRIESTISNT